MKKIILISVVTAVTGCGGSETTSSSTPIDTIGETTAEETCLTKTGAEMSHPASETDETDPASENRWTLRPCNDGFTPGGGENSFSAVAEVTSGEIAIEQKGSDAGIYYVGSPTINVTRPVVSVGMIAIGLELLDETETPIPYTYTLAGHEYSNTVYLLSNISAMERALKTGGECKLTFRIDPADIVVFTHSNAGEKFDQTPSTMAGSMLSLVLMRRACLRVGSFFPERYSHTREGLIPMIFERAT